MKLAPIENNQAHSLFQDLDLFLTGLIIERAPVNARTGLSNWLGMAEKETPKKTVKTKTPSRKVTVIV